MTNEVERYRAADQQQLIQTMDAVCAECIYMQTRQFKPNADWQHALAFPDCDHHFLGVARSDDRVVGWARLFPAADWNGQPAYELGIGLLHEYRKKGLGRRLIACAFEWACSKKAGAIVLLTHPENSIAQQLFLKAGFTIVGVEKDGLRMVALLV